jgi:23S rRNA pseudouridine1911/1915/1917 synthase
VCRHLADVPTATRTRVQAWIDAGRVLVNGRRAARVAARVQASDRITVALPAAPARRPVAAQPLALTIRYEDESLLVIDKPAGVVVHPTYRHADGTIMNALLWHARTWPAGHRPSLVGRLDKNTSGLVLVAKTRAVHAALQRTLARPASEKSYLALVHGRVRPARGTIDLPLGRDPRDRRRVVVTPEHGLSSTTRYERLVYRAAGATGVSLLRCRLITGRMHQIRVHLSARGWPIVGDSTYGGATRSNPGEMTPGTPRVPPSRHALHAWRLGFAHPTTGARVEIEAPLPQDFAALLDEYGIDSAAPGVRTD